MGEPRRGDVGGWMPTGRAARKNNFWPFEGAGLGYKYIRLMRLRVIRWSSAGWKKPSFSRPKAVPFSPKDVPVSPDGFLLSPVGACGGQATMNDEG